MTSAPVIRVLNGRLEGTDKPLPPAGTVSIGHEFWQDVVIRDAATKGIAVDLTTANGAAQLMVLSGEAQLLGSRLDAGQTAILPPYVPFSIGGVALAWGEPDSERWADAGGLAASQPTPPALPPGPTDRALAAAQVAHGRVMDQVLARPRLIGGAVIALALVLMLVMVPNAVASLGLFGSPQHRAQRALAEAGFTGLSVAPDGRDGVVVGGIVSDETARAGAQAALAGAKLPALWRVQTNAGLANATADVARIHNVRATARPLGLRVVELRTVPIPVDQRDRLIAAIRSDVPGIRRLMLRGDLPPVEEAPIRTVADATKKVSTVVAGDPSYIQTVDGARYFQGATLPTGHRLVGIRGNVVVLEKGGQETQIAF